jgi:hypothetical protein
MLNVAIDDAVLIPRQGMVVPTEIRLRAGSKVTAFDGRFRVAETRRTAEGYVAGLMPADASGVMALHNLRLAKRP